MWYEPMGVQVFDIMFFEIVGVLKSAGWNSTCLVKAIKK